jgi:hypothetical protein
VKSMAYVALLRRSNAAGGEPPHHAGPESCQGLDSYRRVLGRAPHLMAGTTLWKTSYMAVR